jgi:hypothetical protein
MNDISQFVRWNVADTCSLWNLLASRLLYSTARSAGVTLCCTQFVIYECLHKPGLARPEREELQRRLKARLADGSITAHPIDIEDLQDVEILRSRKKLSIGELSVIVFARKTAQAILTDDRGAQNLARTALAVNTVQSTPHLFAWLYFNSLLSDSDKEQVAADLLLLSRSLKPHLENYHAEAQRCRAIATQAANFGN